MGMPALVIGEEEKTAVANFQAVCDFYAKEIEILEKNKRELKDLVKLESVLYEKLNSSSGICKAIGYLALPDCAMKEEGTKKERVNVFDRLDDECAEDKTNKITKSLKTVLGLGTEPSGQVVFRNCKDIFVKIILEQFKKMQGLISSQCDQSLSTGPGARRKRSYGGGYYPGGYDPSTIWFQYLLCHERRSAATSSPRVGTRKSLASTTSTRTCSILICMVLAMLAQVQMTIFLLYSY